ncbi:MAG: methyltransferase domain-containing protein [Candidatus Sulfotelmatobacter sp.]
MNASNTLVDPEMATTAQEGAGPQAVTCEICGGEQLADLLMAPDRFHLRTEVYRLVRCESCRAVSLADPPRPEEMGRHYTEDYHKAIVAGGEWAGARRWKDQVKMISQHKSGGAILDIGCSSGGFLGAMRGPAWKLYGIEMEESTAERARAITGAEVFVGDAIAAPFLPASFDAITAFDLLEHVYAPRQFLAKVLEWLKPGGIFYAMMPNIDSWEARLFGSYWYGLELPRHLSHFSPASIRYVMTELGFEEVSVGTPKVSYLERSTGYVCSSVLEKFGFEPTPQSKPKPRSLPMKVVSKGFRIAVATPLAQLASVAGEGPCMEVVFRKSQH